MSDLLTTQVHLDNHFDESFKKIRKAQRRRERFPGEAWVTDWAHDAEIGLNNSTFIEGYPAKIVYRYNTDLTSDMVASLHGGRHGQIFRVYVKGPEDTRLVPQTDLSGPEMAERFGQLLNQADVALVQ